MNPAAAYSSVVRRRCRQPHIRSSAPGSVPIEPGQTWHARKTSTTSRPHRRPVDHPQPARSARRHQITSSGAASNASRRRSISTSASSACRSAAFASSMIERRVRAGRDPRDAPADAPLDLPGEADRPSVPQGSSPREPPRPAAPGRYGAPAPPGRRPSPARPAKTGDRQESVRLPSRGSRPNTTDRPRPPRPPEYPRQPARRRRSTSYRIIIRTTPTAAPSAIDDTAPDRFDPRATTAPRSAHCAILHRTPANEPSAARGSRRPPRPAIATGLSIGCTSARKSPGID